MIKIKTVKELPLKTSRVGKRLGEVAQQLMERMSTMKKGQMIEAIPEEGKFASAKLKSSFETANINLREREMEFEFKQRNGCGYITRIK